VTTTTTEIDLDTVDLMDPDLYQDGPPHELFARLRAESPVRWMHSSTGDFWAVTRAEDIAAVSKDTATFSSNKGGVFLREDAPLPVDIVRSVMLGMDPPQHTRYRMIVQKVFTPNAIAALEETIRARVTRVIDEVSERGECDLVSDIAVELPLQTIAEILGVPHEDRMQLFHWTNRIEAAGTEGTGDGLAAFGELAMYLAGLVAQRRETPTDDLLSKLVHAEVEGEKLDDLELTAFFGLLMFAGNDTTRNTTSGGALALLQHPDQWALLRGNPSLINGAVEEMLRWVTPVMWFRRTVTQDTELDDVSIKEGDSVVIFYTSGSYDEAVVDDPTRFDVTRVEVAHQAFGGGGRHFCLGSGLARLQMRILFTELLRRTPDLALAGTPSRGRSNWVNGLEALPVKFTPSPREGAA
jgi:cytochrome P450